MFGMRGAGWLVGVCTVALLAAGCGRESGPLKVAVRGEVTLDGKPVPQGQIVLSDAAGVGQSFGGEIRDGEYSVRVTLGKKKVSISSMQVVSGKQSKYGGIQGDPVSAENPADVYEEVIPPQYNAKTELTADVSEKGPNEFSFALQSAKKK